MTIQCFIIFLLKQIGITGFSMVLRKYRILVKKTLDFLIAKTLDLLIAIMF